MLMMTDQYQYQYFLFDYENISVNVLKKNQTNSNQF